MMRERISVFLFVSVSTVACTSLLGDFTFSEQPSDGGHPRDAAVADVGSVDMATVRAITSDVSVYLGQTATLDASRSTTTQGSLAFAWTLTSTPPGSRITAASLTGANSATVTLVPDTAGDFVLQVSVQGVGATDVKSATVRAAVPQVLFAQGVTSGASGGGVNPSSAYYTIADSDGGNAHPVLCPDVIDDARNQDLPAPFAAYAGRAYDYWEGPPGQLSKFAAFTVDFALDGGFSTHLWAGTSLSTCGVPPADLGATLFGPGSPFGAEPHFSPDGMRFVVFDRQWRIVTFAADGKSPPQVVATYPVPYPQASSFLDPVGLETNSGYLFEPPRVTWTESGQALAWAQPTVSGWEIVTAPDTANAKPTTYMTCPGVTPREIAVLSDGTVIASYRQSPQSSENLYQLKPDAQQNCSREHQYTNLADSGSSTATDFAVSPDGTQIAFLQIDTSLQDASRWTLGGSRLPGGYLYVVPVAGDSPKQVSSDPAIYGPRWIGGGTALVFTRLDGVPPSTGRPATSIIVIAPDGGGGHVIAQGNGVSTFVSTSGNAACGVAQGPARGPRGREVVALGLVAVGYWARRRRRRSVRGHSCDRR
jgi:hypothetical protein